ncbi:MAG TPA: CBS domain-containing protein [Candidatus Binatia bacterium]|nr:CBS domain-containing protein [Candidatus Binatia bacterium]
MLSNKVSEIMTTNLTNASVASSIQEVLEMMVTADVGRIIVTNKEVPVGIFTEKDVMKRVVNNNSDPRKSTIKEVMTSPIRAVREETHIVEAFGKMYRGKYRHLLVRGRRGKIVGIVSMRRILGLAVELGQGMSETKTLGGLVSGGALSVDESSSVYETINLMIQKGVASVVVSASGKPRGIFTERDVLKRVAAKGIDTRKTQVKQVMTSPLITMADTALIGEALTEMYRRDIRNMPVMGAGGELIGIVSMPDILQYAAAFNIDEKVRQTWKEIQAYYDSEDQYTPG